MKKCKERCNCNALFYIFATKYFTAFLYANGFFVFTFKLSNLLLNFFYLTLAKQKTFSK